MTQAPYSSNTAPTVNTVQEGIINIELLDLQAFLKFKKGFPSLDFSPVYFPLRSAKNPNGYLGGLNIIDTLVQILAFRELSSSHITKYRTPLTFL